MNALSTAVACKNRPITKLVPLFQLSRTGAPLTVALRPPASGLAPLPPIMCTVLLPASGAYPAVNGLLLVTGTAVPSEPSSLPVPSLWS